MGWVPAMLQDPSHVKSHCADGEHHACMRRGSHLLKWLGLLTGRLPMSHNSPQMTSACLFPCHAVHHSGVSGVRYQHPPSGHSWQRHTLAVDWWVSNSSGKRSWDGVCSKTVDSGGWGASGTSH